jgi:hypothetical protein
VCTASIIRAMLMQAVHTSEMSVYFNETTWFSIPESCHLGTYRHENLKCHEIYVVFGVIVVMLAVMCALRTTTLRYGHCNLIFCRCDDLHVKFERNFIRFLKM